MRREVRACGLVLLLLTGLLTVGCWAVPHQPWPAPSQSETVKPPTVPPVDELPGFQLSPSATPSRSSAERSYHAFHAAKGAKARIVPPGAVVVPGGT